MLDSMEAVGSNSIRAEGILSVMLAPLVQNGKVLGVLYLDSVLHIAPFEENDLKLLKVVGEMVSVAVDRNLKAQTVLRQSEELAHAQQQVEIAAEETITRLSRAAEYRDGETSEHLVRVSLYCEALARKLGIEEREVHLIKIASLLHDVGKLGIPDSVMLKPGRFTQYERQLMQKHTVFGGRILADSDSRIVQLAGEIALGHHEKWDGSGYPAGLSGEQIPMAARIVAIADVFDAVSSARRYKASYSLSESFQMIEEGAGSHFDPVVSEAFLQISDLIEQIWEKNQTPEKFAEPVVEEPPAEVAQPCLNGDRDSPWLWILDSDPFQRERLSTEAVRRGYRVLESSCGLELTRRLDTEQPDAGVVEIADVGAAALVWIGLRQRARNRSYGIVDEPRSFFIARNAIVAAAIIFITYKLSTFRGLPNVLLTMGVLTIIYAFLTQNTVIGRRIYALGGNAKAAKLSGIKTERLTFLAFVNMGILAAAAGLVFAARLNTATPKAGFALELDVIAAVFIGGASMSGGVGTIVGAVVGAFLMGVLNNGMSIMGIGIDYQQMIKGLVLLAAVVFDVYNKQKQG